jgi:hypothetical protein
MVYPVASAAVLCTTVLGDDEEAKVPCQGAGVKVPRGAGKLAAGPVCARVHLHRGRRAAAAAGLCAPCAFPQSASVARVTVHSRARRASSMMIMATASISAPI